MNRVLGTTEEVTVCDACGREDLKKTVAIALCDCDGNELAIEYYGVVCASHIAKRSTKDIISEARQADLAKYKAEQAVYDKKRKAEFDEWAEFLDAMTPPNVKEVFNQIQHLGGYKIARSLFKSQ